MASLDDLPMQDNLVPKSLPTSRPNSAMIDGLPIGQQEIRRIPAVQGPGKRAKRTALDEEAKRYVSLIRDALIQTSNAARAATLRVRKSEMSDLVKSSGMYALSSFVSPLVSLALAPFLTHTLSHSDYGALAVLDTVIDLGVGLTQLSLGSAFFRAYNYDYESQKDRSAVLSTVTALLFLTSISTAVTMILAAPWLSALLFNSPSFSNSVRVTGLVILLQNLTVPGFSWLRAESRSALYSFLSIANLLICLSANIVLVGILHMGVPGALLAIGCGYAVVVVCTLPVVLLRAGLSLRLDIARNLLSFGIPLVFNFAAMWVLQLSDRYLLSHFSSLAETAIYSVAYTLGGGLSVVFVTPFSLAWPAAMFAIAKRDDAAQSFRAVFHWYSIALLLAAFALSLVAVGALDILFPPAYHSGAAVIPIIALSITFAGANYMLSVGVPIRRKNWLGVIFTALAALVNVGANLILIPLYGSMGAAVSTLIAYVVRALISYIVNQRIYPVPYEIGRFIIALLIGIALYAGSDALARTQGIGIGWGIRICALVLYAGCLALMSRFPTLDLKRPQSREVPAP
jgi:O-antigen/teichoic acid export membrane protein